MAKYEEPKYDVLQSEKNIEIRQYTNTTAAQIGLEGDREQCLNEGFMILAGYIFGKNTRKQKISMTSPVVASGKTKIDENLYRSENIPMTAPVTTSSNDNKKWTIRFYMPSSYNKDNLPIPDNKKIQIIELPMQKYAVLKFSGFGSAKTFSKKAALLKKYLADKNIVAIGSPLAAYYNPPWTLPFLRRNEIMIPIN